MKWIQIDGTNELHTAFLTQNEHHLMASNISLFAYGPLKEAIKQQENTGTSIATLLSKETIEHAYGHLSNSVSKILEEVEQKQTPKVTH